MTRLGKLGGIVSTPVINHPEVAIVGTNRVVARPSRAEPDTGPTQRSTGTRPRADLSWIRNVDGGMLCLPIGTLSTSGFKIMSRTVTETRLPASDQSTAYDAAKFEAHLATSAVLFEPGLTQARLSEWVSSSGHSGFLSGLVFFIIRWDKRLGLPYTPHMKDAFVVRQVGHHKKIVTYGGALKVIETDIDYPEPSKIDGPLDAAYYEVTVQAFVTPDEPTTFSVEFAPHIAWPSTPMPIRGLLAVTPREQTMIKGQGPVVLKPFEVVREPVHLFTP